MTFGFPGRDYSAMAPASASSKLVVAAELYPENDCVWIIAADPRRPDSPVLRQLNIPGDRLDLAAELVRRCELTLLACEMLAEICARVAAELYSLAEGAKALVVSPHGPLHMLPLSAGCVPDCRCLAEAIPTAVMPSTSFLSVLAAAQPQISIKGATVLKGPEMDSGKSVATVTSALEEMFLDVHPDLPLRVVNYPRRLSRGSILLVAAHGRPAELLLADKEGRPTWVTAGQLAEKLGRPAFVLLAVCRSATSEVADDEEPLGIVWPLLANGARAVISSLWDVESKAAAAFARRSVGWMLQGDPVGKAFGRALGGQFNDCRITDYRDRAGFVLNGDWRLRLTR